MSSLVKRAPILIPVLMALGVASAGSAQQLALHVETDPARVLVGISLVTDMGSVSDPAGYSGLTSVTAEAIERTLTNAPSVVRAEVTVTRGQLEFTLLARPDDWAEATRLLRELVFGSGPSEASFEAARVAAVERFQFTADTPLREVDLEAARLFAGFESEWSRPVVGTPATISSIRHADVGRVQRIWMAGRWGAALTGPVDAFQAEAILGATADSLAAEAVPPSAAALWDQPDRIRIAREVTSTWIVAAFPLPADLTLTRSDHLIHRVEELLNPVPSDPGLFEARAERVQLPLGPVLLVRASVLPEASDRWEALIRELPTRIEPPADPDFFRWERRRFRAHLLLADAAPDRHARRLAMDLMLIGSVRDLREEAWTLEPDDLADAASRLSPPRILVFGPDLGADDGREW